MSSLFQPTSAKNCVRIRSRGSELRKQLYIPVSRSEEGSQGRSERFPVRGVHRSEAKTLDGLRSEGYLQWSTPALKLFGKAILVSEVASIPRCPRSNDHEFHYASAEGASPQRGV